jgi:hypothetical protein
VSGTSPGPLHPLRPVGLEKRRQGGVGGFDRGAVARAIAAGVASVPGVRRLHPGRGVEAATQYPGGKVVGVELGARRLRVHVVLDLLPVGPVVRRVHAVAGTVLRAAGLPLPVEVVVEDLDGGALQAAASAPAREGHR